ncbi:MAG: phosphoribosylformylglycinamidine synthase subunit PurS [Candidatus Bathyarchaeia archaeon]
MGRDKKLSTPKKVITEMKFAARVHVTLKEGYSDPEGETTARALKGLGYRVLDVRVGKVYDLSLEAEDEEDARRLIEEICLRLLANPTKDDYSFELRGVG